MTDTAAHTGRTSKRWALAAGAAGLVGGLALGATGLASAVTPSPTPESHEVQRAPKHAPDHPGKGGPGRHRPGKAGADQHRGGGGMVSAISASSLTVRTPRGTKSFGLNDSTTYYSGKTKTTRSAVEVGDIVRVLVADPKASSPVASTVTVLPARVGGWVTEVSGSTITLTDHDGFTRTVSTSSSTEFRKDGEPATLAAVTVGSFVRALGEVAADGTTLNASRVGVGFPANRDGKGNRGEKGERRAPADAHDSDV